VAGVWRNDGTDYPVDEGFLGSSSFTTPVE
jgi:hypothetical protein